MTISKQRQIPRNTSRKKKTFLASIFECILNFKLSFFKLTHFMNINLLTKIFKLFKNIY